MLSSSTEFFAVLLMMATNLPATFLAHFFSSFEVRREMRGREGVEVLWVGVEPVHSAVDRGAYLPVRPFGLYSVAPSSVGGSSALVIVGFV